MTLHHELSKFHHIELLALSGRYRLLFIDNKCYIDVGDKLMLVTLSW